MNKDYYITGADNYLEKISSNIFFDYATAIPRFVVNKFKALSMRDAARNTGNIPKKIKYLSKAIKYNSIANRNGKKANNIIRGIQLAGSVGGIATAMKAIDIALEAQKSNEELNNRMELASQGIKTYNFPEIK